MIRIGLIILLPSVYQIPNSESIRLQLPLNHVSGSSLILIMQGETVKRHSYNDNLKHKEKQLKKVKLTSLHECVRDHLLDKFNFKKTTAWKGMWSCSGYGGKCASCKNSYNEPKKFQKEYFNNFDGELCSYITKTH